MKRLIVLLSLVIGFSYAQQCEDSFRPFEHAAGTTCIPKNPERIVTTQDQNALLPLLELGVKPIGSAGQILEDGGYRFRRVAEYDTEGIVFIGGYWGEANLEAITRLNPDLIVSHELAEQFYDLQSEIAPTVMIQIFDRPLNEALLEFAELVGREDQARALEAEYRGKVASLLEQFGERKGELSVAAITVENEGTFYRADSGQAVGTVMDDLDLLRPAPQQTRDNDERGYQSLESLREHDADVILVFDFSGKSQSSETRAFLESPVFRTLAASQAGQVYVIDGTQTVGAAWGKMNAYLDELEHILLDPELRTDVVQE